MPPLRLVAVLHLRTEQRSVLDGGDDFDSHIRRIAERDFGGEGADDALRARELWSDAPNDYVPTNEDQYGRSASGSLPFLFLDRSDFPDVPYAHFGARIMKAKYRSHAPETSPPKSSC